MNRQVCSGPRTWWVHPRKCDPTRHSFAFSPFPTPPRETRGATISGRRPIQTASNPRRSDPSLFVSFRVFRGPPSPSVVEPRNTRNTRKGARHSRPNIRPDSGGTTAAPIAVDPRSSPDQTASNPRRSDPSLFVSFRVFRGPPSPSVVEPRNTRKGSRRSEGSSDPLLVGCARLLSRSSSPSPSAKSAKSAALPFRFPG